MGAYIKSLNLVTAKNGMLTANVVTTSHQQFHLHSTYNPEKEAKDWLKQFDLTENTMYIVLGFGLGYHVKVLLEAMAKTSHIFVIEHSLEENMLTVSREIFSNPKWMFDERLDCAVSEDVRDIAANINKKMQEKAIKRIVMCRYFPMMQIYPDFYKKIEVELVSKTQELFSIDYDYRLSATSVVARNAWLNLAEICTSPGIAPFKDAFSDVPVIMVAGGPSLNKNIHLLKEYQNKAIIICAGSTIGALHHHGVKPHFLVAVDPFKGMENEILEFSLPETKLIAPYIIPYELIEKYPGEKYFFALAENSPNINAISGLKELLPDTSTLYANISVAISALSFGLYTGAKKIILMGQDLAFGKNLQSHADGSKAWTLIEGMEYESLLDVKGYYGETVKTIPIFKEAIEYYGSLFNYRKDIQFINATEGGAYLEGAEHLSFQEVVERYIDPSIDAALLIEQRKTVTEQTKADKVLIKLQEAIRMGKNLQEMGDELMKRTEKCPQYLSMQSVEEVEVCLAYFEEYFKRVKMSPFYVHLIPYLHALFELYEYQKQDGYEDLEDYFLNQVMMYIYIKNALTDLLSHMEVSLKYCQERFV